MRFLLRFIFRLILLGVFTFGFVVLYEHGPAKFPEGARTEWNALLFFVGSVISKQENAPPRGTTRPAPSPVAADSPLQKARQAGASQPATGTPVPTR